MQIRQAQEAEFQRVMELYRQLQPDDYALTDGKDHAVFQRILREQWLSLLVLADLGQYPSSAVASLLLLTRLTAPDPCVGV